jgi:ABC-type lipopolysaccharide export system ATPase subunit
LAGIIPIEQGELLFDDLPIEHLSVWQRVRRGIAILQARDHYFRNLTVKETLRLCNPPSTETSWLSKLLDRQVASLSGGERQRVAMSLLKPDRLGIYDEPFSALDLSAATTEALHFYVRRHEATIIFLPRLDEK